MNAVAKFEIEVGRCESPAEEKLGREEIRHREIPRLGPTRNEDRRLDGEPCQDEGEGPAPKERSTDRDVRYIEDDGGDVCREGGD